MQTSVGDNHMGMNNKSLIFETTIVGEEPGLPEEIRIRGWAF
jgi:hypothetical protein